MNAPTGASVSENANAIEVDGLTKRYGRKTVVDALSMQVRRGEIYGFLGPNGSGKTTSIRMMCGLLTPDAGSGHTLGFDVVKQAGEIKRRVGYMTQRFGLYDDLSIRQNLDFIARVYGMPERRAVVDRALDDLGLASRQQQLAGTLSGGWKQRMALAACMLHEPELLLLDEPTAGVDPGARRDFWNEIHRLAARGITVLVSTHYMDEAERCHRLGYIAYGRLLAIGTPAELVAESGLAARRTEAAATPAQSGALEAHADVEAVTRMGGTLRVCGADAAALDEALRTLTPGLAWTGTAPTLEEVFIHLSRRAAAGDAAAPARRAA